MKSRYRGLDDPFAAYSAAETPSAFQWAGQPPKLLLPWTDLDILSITMVQLPDGHFDRFSRFPRLTLVPNRQTDRQTTLHVTFVQHAASTQDKCCGLKCHVTLTTPTNLREWFFIHGQRKSNVKMIKTISTCGYVQL